MSYSNKASQFLRTKQAIIAEDLEKYLFDSFSQSWKKVGAYNPEATNLSTNADGLVRIEYPSTFNYENDALAAAIILTTVDSDGQTINWNVKNEETDMLGRLPNFLNPGLVTLRGNRLTISPQNVLERDNRGDDNTSSVGMVQHVNLYTDDSPNFTTFEPIKYQTVDGKRDGGTNNWQQGSGYRRRNGRFEFSIAYSHDAIHIYDFNTSKVLDLVQFGTAKTFFASTPTGSRSNVDNNHGIVYRIETGLAEALPTRLYQLEDNRITSYSNNATGTSLSSIHSTNNRLGRYEFKNDVVASARGIGMDSAGSKAFILSTSATTHPAKTIVEYDIDTPYDITTMTLRRSYYNDIKIGSKTQLRDNGKYLYSLRYSDYAYENNGTYVNQAEGYGHTHRDLTSQRLIGRGGFDWPLKAYIYRYDLEKDYTSTEPGTIYTAPFECDKTYNASFYDYHKSIFQFGYPSFNQRQFSGGVSLYSSIYMYWSHRGPVVGFDMTDGHNMYLITTKAFNRGHLVHKALGTQWDPTSETGVNTIQHGIGTEAGNIKFLANWKTNGVWDVKVNNDGTSVYILDTSTFAIYQYDMSSPHDLSTLNRTELLPVAKTLDTNGYDKVLFLSANIPATASSPPRTFDSEVSDGISIPMPITNTGQRQNATQPNFFRDFSMVRSFNFNNDGSRVYINNDHRIYQYNLSTAFDISTALFVGSTEKYRVHMEDKHNHIGVGHYIDSTNKKFYIGNEKYELNKENQGVVREFNLVDSVGSGVEPFLEKVHVLDSDNWQDIHLNDSAKKMYISGPNKIKVLNLNSSGIISSVSVESNYEWDSAEKFSGASITSDATETNFYVADSAKLIRMVTLGNSDSIVSVGKDYTAVGPSTENTVVRGMTWFGAKNFIIAGNNRIDHFKSKDSFQVADI